MGKRMTRTIRVALSVTGSAILLFSCADKDAGRASASEETMMTEYSEDLSVVMSQNGRRSYHFVTPLLEGYSLAREPYREFRKGVKITTYQNDSLTTVDAVLTANYAIYYENRELWEAKGNVVVEKSDGKTLYTQQLFWNARTKKFERRFEDRAEQRPRCIHRRRFRIGRGVQGLAFSPHEGPYGGRDEAERRLRGHGFHVRAPGSETLRQPALRQPALRQPARRPDVRIREGR